MMGGRRDRQLLRSTLGQLAQHLCSWFCPARASSDLGRADILWLTLGKVFTGYAAFVLEAPTPFLPSQSSRATGFTLQQLGPHGEPVKAETLLSHAKTKDRAKPEGSWGGDKGLHRHLIASLGNPLGSLGFTQCRLGRGTHNVEGHRGTSDAVHLRT